jgi:hypothetical protein
MREDPQRIGVVAVHVLDDAGGQVGQRVRPGAPVLPRGHPVHGPEAADEVHVLHTQTPEGEVLEIHPVLRLGVARQVGRARGGPLVLGQPSRSAHERDASASERVVLPSRLDHEQTGSRIGREILGVHRHAADQEQRAAALVGHVRHHRAEGSAGVLARESGQRARSAQGDERARPLGVRGLRRRRGLRLPWTGMAVHPAGLLGHSAWRPVALSRTPRRARVNSAGCSSV